MNDLDERLERIYKKCLERDWVWDGNDEVEEINFNWYAAKSRIKNLIASVVDEIVPEPQLENWSIGEATYGDSAYDAASARRGYNEAIEIMQANRQRRGL